MMTKTGYLKASAVVLVAALAASILVLAAAEPTEAAFPGKNGKIIHVNGKYGQEVRAVNSDGTEMTKLTKNNGELIHDYAPTWSPDGTKVAFASDRDAPDLHDPGRDEELYVMNADGSNLRRLTETPTQSEGSPTWSPDGEQIAFVRDDDIYTMNLDGAGETQITTNPDYDSGPAWSPDGSKIAFVSRRDGRYSIHAMAPVPEGDGNQPERLAGGAGGFDPDWSPDGEKIAFTGNAATPGAHDPYYEVYVMNADGTDSIRLTTKGGRNPAWSPNGKKIAFVRYNQNIFVINSAAPESDTNRSRQVTKYGRFFSSPFGVDWQPSPR